MSGTGEYETMNGTTNATMPCINCGFRGATHYVNGAGPFCGKCAIQAGRGLRVTERPHRLQIGDSGFYLNCTAEDVRRLVKAAKAFMICPGDEQFDRLDEALAPFEKEDEAI